MTAPKTTKNESISILICSRDRRSDLEHLVSLLLEMTDIHSFEIVVVEETDSPRSIERVIYVPHPIRNLGIPYARNLALKKATGQIIVFIDDDITPSENWLANLLDPFKDESVGAVGGAILPDPSNINLIGKCISFLGFPAGGLERYIKANGASYDTKLISTGNCAFRKEIADKIGGFDQLLRWGGEDQDFFSRMNAVSRTLFNPDAIIFHKQRSSLQEVFTWFIRRGKADFYTKCKDNHPLYSLIFPLRCNFLLKLASVFILFVGLFSISGLYASVLFIFAPIIWTIILWNRNYMPIENTKHHYVPERIKKIRNEILCKEVKWSLFYVKFTMDFGHEIGKLISISSYLWNRIFLKPCILTFHHLGSPEDNKNSLFSKYYCSKDKFAEIIEAGQKEGRRLISLSEIVKRLKDNPNCLYFERIFSVTFDDGYLSIFEPLAELSVEHDLPVTIFFPTALIGKTNTWDQDKGSRREEIMNWEQIETLRSKGFKVGSHARNHIDLRKSESRVQISEIMGSHEDLNSNLLNIDEDQLIFSYPYGGYNQDIIELVKQAGFIGATANHQGNIRPTTDPYQIPRFTVFDDSDWKRISSQSHSMWAKDLLKDIRDWCCGVISKLHTYPET